MVWDIIKEKTGIVKNWTKIQIEWWGFYKGYDKIF